MAILTARSATIFIASGEHNGVYRSVDEVPPELRRKLIETTNSVNSATILIADRRGRDEISKAIRNLPSAIQQRLLHSVLGSDSPSTALRWLTPTFRRVLAVFLGVACLLFVWLIFSYRWR